MALTATATDPAGNSTEFAKNVAAPAGGVTGGTGGVVPLSPQRLLDTRAESAVGYAGPKPGVGATVELVVTGGSVPADASSVVLNVTGTEASGPGFVTVWPCGSPRPTASNLNLVAGATVANLVMAKVGAGGKVCLFTQSGTHLIADLAGYTR
jgi:hypothetical protein